MTWALYIAGDKANCQQSTAAGRSSKRRKRENDGWGPQTRPTTESYDNFVTTTPNTWGRSSHNSTWGSYYAAKGVIFGGSAFNGAEQNLNFPSPVDRQRSFTGAPGGGTTTSKDWFTGVIYFLLLLLFFLILKGSCYTGPGVGFCSLDGKMINSIYLEFEHGDDLVIATNGIPVHDYEVILLSCKCPAIFTKLV